MPVLRLIAFAMPALASSIVFTKRATRRPVKHSHAPVLISWFGFLGELRIPLAYLLTGAGYGLFGAWVAMVADIWVRGALIAFSFAGGRWKRIEV